MGTQKTDRKTYYVIQPTLLKNQPVSVGEALSLTDSQARPLHHGGFITSDKIAATRIQQLILENQNLNTQLAALHPESSEEKSEPQTSSKKSTTDHQPMEKHKS